MFMALVVAFVVASGCTDTETVPLANASPPVIAPPQVVNATGTSTAVAGGGAANTGKGSIYAVDPFFAQILRFNASDVGLDVTPQATISGALTQLQGPSQLVMDNAGNRLYVLDTGRVLVFDAPKTLTGNVAPARVLIPAVAGALSIALDEVRNILYIGHQNNGITSYDAASTLQGAITPNRTIAGAATNVLTATGLFVDANNRLVEADFSTESINTFDGAATATGNVAPTRSITGALTTFIDPFAVAIDNIGTIFMGDVSSQLFYLYSNGATATGNVAPTFSFTPAQSLTIGIRQLAIEDGSSMIGAHSGNAGTVGGIYTWQLNDLRAGNAAPLRIIQAPTANLLFVTGVAHDPTR